MDNNNNVPTKPDELDERLKNLYDEEVEKTVLGVLMAYDGIYQQMRDQLNENLFYFLKWKELFKAIKSIGDNGDYPDMVCVVSKLAELKIETISAYEIANLVSMGNSSNLQRYISILENLATRRSLWQQGMTLATDVVKIDKPLEEIISNHKVNVDRSIFASSEESIHSLSDVLKDVADTMYRNQNDETRVRGAMTGFRMIDEKGGWQPTNLIIIAADSSQGKSSFALNSVIHAMEGGEKVAFYSLEMTREQLVSRILSAKTGIGSNSILWDKLTFDEYNLLMKNINDIDQKVGENLFFDDKSTSSLDQIITSIRKQKLKYGITGAVVDYLQILNVNDDSRKSSEQKMADASRRLKNLAKELNIWIVSLSQLNRDRDNPVPSMARIRESGQIAEAADIVLLIYRPEIYDKRYPEPFSNKSTQGTAMIDICKGRNIGLVKFLVWFDARRCLFFDAVTPIPEYTPTQSALGTEFYQAPDF